MNIKKWLNGVCLGIVFIAGLLMIGMSAQAGTVYNSPYVTFSPDGNAFTTNHQDTNWEWYEEGTEVTTGIPSSLRGLEVGEHYYRKERMGDIPIEKWKVVHKTGTCCHSNYPAEAYYHGVDYRKQVCLDFYYSGWYAYCADCHEPITRMLTYMSKEAAQSITELDLSLEYYYTCPHCTNLEQGSHFDSHSCKAISWNKYKVKYIENANRVGGYMDLSTHMYSNATEYEGQPITPATRLTKNTFTRTGYEFVGWNTEVDGSGTSFTDSQEIFNLTTDNYDGEGIGIITLYAQWKESESTLHINPNGGTYQGNSQVTSVTQTYRTTYYADPREVVAPEGYQVSFVTGYSVRTPDITQTRTFIEWQHSNVFHGKLVDNTYTYLGTQGKEDTITATYSYDSITLPTPVGFEGGSSSFGGWYYDQQCTSPAGKAGDKITPSSDLILYAKRVDLLLRAVNNMNPYGGSGAVDLSWEQNDGFIKKYLLYQSTDNNTWNRIYGATDMAETKNVNKSFDWNANGSNQGTYTIPYTGFYNLTAFGAQGGNYDSYKGGYGGQVEGKIWLTKGEVVTYILGGKDGSNGGGIGTHYANGGGYTIITTDQKGTVLVAGGGGGATSIGNGKEGGSTANIVSSGSDGEVGGAGGGGGYLGGKAGEYIVHNHTEDCYRTVDLGFIALNALSNMVNYEYTNGYEGGYYLETKKPYSTGAHTRADNNMAKHIIHNIGTNDTSSMTVDAWIHSWGVGHINTGDSCLVVRNQNGTEIFKKYVNEIPSYANEGELFNHTGQAFMSQGGLATSSGFANCATNSNHNDGRGNYHETIELPEGTTSVTVEIRNSLNSHDSGMWFLAGINQVSFSGTKQVLTCPYTEGEVLSAKPAYGGSNYVNTTYVTSNVSNRGIKEDSGSFAITSDQIGFEDELYLNEVKATDLASPTQVVLPQNAKTDLGNNQVKVIWNKSRDKGTVYYHKAESYQNQTNNKISTSNITRNEMISGIKGYYYLINTIESTMVGATNGIFTSDTFATVPAKEYVQYLHISAVDMAGNISSTTHVSVALEDSEIAWNVYTDKIQISSQKDSIFLSNRTDTYYVRADGKTPFSLNFNGYIKNNASKSYQVNHLIFDTSIKDSNNSSNIQYCLQVPNSSIIENTSIRIPHSDIHKTWSDSPLLLDDNYLTMKRSDYCKNLEILNRFTMPSSLHGKTIKVTPRAGADWQSEIIYSNYEKDFSNSIYLIGDSVPPVISGTEVFEDWNHATWSAKDVDSGLREFYINVTNHDNRGSRTFTASEEGLLSIDISEEDALFSGDFAMEFHAVDRVGNETVEYRGSRNLSVKAYVERILEPHTPIFRGGESGNLYITTRGYVDKVEIIFPEELVMLNDKLNQVIEYPIPSHHKEEVYKFMIPLYSPEGTFQVKIKAYKNQEVRECDVSLTTLGEDENVLNDIRTRLR